MNGVIEPGLAPGDLSAPRRPRVLVIARNYPNNILPTLGIWTARFVQASTGAADPTVIAPVPYAPPGIPIEAFARFRRVARQRHENGTVVHHPRVLVGPGYLLHSFEASLGYPRVRRLADRLHRQAGFDLIHAHFIYPDGVIAARLGQRYGIPVITTEPAPWLPWLRDYPRVGCIVNEALAHIRVVTAVSESLRQNIAAAAGPTVATEVLYNVADDETFRAPAPGERWDPDQILFIGVVRHVKGLDVLAHALARLASRRPKLRLVVVGAAYYRGYQKDEADARAVIDQLGLGTRVVFIGQVGPAEVAAALRRSAVLVVPSRRETFSTVTVEALASGTPVVATRCGGPEETLTRETGRLVPAEDPEALAAGIEEVLETREAFDPGHLRHYAVSKFGRAAAAARLESLYARVLTNRIGRSHDD